jgi:hypothetical protein
MMCACDVALFYEPFEDGDLTLPAPGWRDYNLGSYWPSLPDPGMDPGNHWLRLEGPMPPDLDSAYYHVLGNTASGIKPDSIRFDILPYFYESGDWASFNISAITEDPTYCGDSLVRSYQAIGLAFYVKNVPYTGDVPTVRSNNADIGTWSPLTVHHVELRNIAWDSTPQTFDVYVNGEFLATRPFSGQGDAAPWYLPEADWVRGGGFISVSLINDRREQGYLTTYWDNIQMLKSDTFNPLLSISARFARSQDLPERYDTFDLNTCSADVGIPPISPPVSASETSTSTPTSTATVTPTPTVSPTPTPPLRIVVIANQNLNCRRGTSTQFETLYILMKGEIANVTAVNPDHTWAFLEIPGRNLYCWAWRGGLEDSQGSADDAPAREDPPTPTPTFTATTTPIQCSPELSKDDCIASGGIWPEGIGAAPICICP